MVQRFLLGFERPMNSRSPASRPRRRFGRTLRRILRDRKGESRRRHCRVARARWAGALGGKRMDGKRLKGGRGCRSDVARDRRNATATRSGDASGRGRRRKSGRESARRLLPVGQRTRPNSFGRRRSGACRRGRGRRAKTAYLTRSRNSRRARTSLSRLKHRTIAVTRACNQRLAIIEVLGARVNVTFDRNSTSERSCLARPASCQEGPTTDQPDRLPDGVGHVRSEQSSSLSPKND
jgi:hypothetical protein